MVERSRPRTGELIAGAAGLLLLAALLLPWYGRETDVAGAVVITESWSAWQTLPVAAGLLFGIAVVAIAVPAARALGAAPAGFRGDRLLVAVGALGLALVLFRLIDLPIPERDLVAGDRAESSRGPGLLLALLATAGIAYGGRLARRH